MKKVTCFYCEYFECLYQFKYPKYTMVLYGLCNKKKTCRSRNAHICDSFKLRQGLHTRKWYPNKQEDD